MLEKGKISPQQFMLLVVLFTIGDSMLFFMSFLVQDAKQDAWMAAMISVGTGLLIFMFYVKVTQALAEKTLVEYCMSVLGRRMGVVVALIFLLLHILPLAASTLRELGDFMNIQYLPRTPIEAIHIVYLSVVILGVRLGLEPIVRTIELLFPWVMALLIGYVLLTIPQLEWQNMLPIFEEGIKSFVIGSLTFVSVSYMEVGTLLMIVPYISQRAKISKAFLLGGAIAGVSLIIIAFMCITVLGVETTANNLYPSYMLAKKISIGRFLERMEVIVSTLWLITLYFKLTFVFYALCLGLAQVWKLQDYRPLTLPVGVLVYVSALMIAENIVQYNSVITPVYTQVHDPLFFLLLPLYLLAAHAFRNRKKKGI